jgi:hypothetical protein
MEERPAERLAMSVIHILEQYTPLRYCFYVKSTMVLTNNLKEIHLIGGVNLVSFDKKYVHRYFH